MKIAELSNKFKSYMKKSNDKTALKFIINNMEDYILPLNCETLNSLKKNPESKNKNNNVLIIVIHIESTQSCLQLSTRNRL